MDRTEIFETERPRLVGIATRVLADPAEAEDVVQQAWLRLHRTGTAVESLPAWLTTVTTRLCLDRLRSRSPVPTAEVEVAEVSPDAADEVALATPERIDGRREVATFFNGSAHAALAVYVDDRPAAAWFHRGEAKVLFDFTIVDGLVGRITFRAEPEVLARVSRRDREHLRG